MKNLINCRILALILILFFIKDVNAQETLTWNTHIPIGGWPGATLGSHSNATQCHSRGTFTSTVANPSGFVLPFGTPFPIAANNNSLVLGMSTVPSGQGITQSFSFGYPVENLTFSIYDIDGSFTWRDRLIITATLAGNPKPITIVTCPTVFGTVCLGSGTNTAQIDAGIIPTGFTAANGRADISIPGAIDNVIIQYQNHTIATSSTQFISLSQITYDCAIVGVSKLMTRRAGQAFGVSPYLVDIDFNFENFGDLNLSNLTAIEDLDASFGVGNYTFSSISKISGPASFSINPSFNGSANQELIGAASSLLPTQTASIRVTINVINYDSYTNQLTVNGTTPHSANTSDLSTNGTNPDGFDADLNPDESIISVLNTTTLAASLSYVSSKLSNDSIILEWQTDIEYEHIGYRIYQENRDKDKQLLSDIISQPINKLGQVRTYQTQVLSQEKYPIWIAEYNNKGEEKYYGPFKIGDKFGGKIQNSKIFWNSTRQRVQNNQSIIDNVLSVAISETGMQRITYNDLLSKGIDLTSFVPKQLQITIEGKNIPLYINGNNSHFDTSTSFDFYAKNVDSLYTDARIYKLQFSNHVNNNILKNTTQPSTTIPSWYWHESIYNPNLIYDFSSPTSDPWRAQKLATFSTPSKSLDFSLNNINSNTAHPIKIHIEISGGLDYQQVPDVYPTDPNRCGANHPDIFLGMPNDHCVELKINNLEFDEIVFDGLSNNINKYTLDSSFNTSENLNILLNLPGETGFAFDIITIEKVAISYPRYLVAIDDKLEFTLGNSALIHNDVIKIINFEANIQEPIFEQNPTSKASITITGFMNNNLVAYSLDPNSVQRITNFNTTLNNNNYQITLPAIARNDKYWVSTERNLIKPQLKPWTENPINNTSNVEYLIIAHPDFIDQSQLLKTRHENNGLNVKIVNVEDIYTHYSQSIIDPIAIKSFIAKVAQSNQLKYVLLVGSDNYDYKGYLSADHFSHIPSIYTAIDDIVRYAPADSLFVDLDDDEIPDLAIGRLPARTQDELQLLIDKQFVYMDNIQNDVTSHFIADSDDLNYSYAQISNQLIQSLPNNWNNQTTYRSDFDSPDATKQNIFTQFSQNPRLTTYLGHSGPRNWFTFPSSFTFNDIDSLQNDISPSVIMQWGCWNSYYVDPEANNMAHKFLFNNQAGAVAVLGATALTSVESEKAFAEKIMIELSNSNQSIGTAMLNAKRNLATQSDYKDVVIGWNLLGDPAIKLSN